MSTGSLFEDLGPEVLTLKNKISYGRKFAEQPAQPRLFSMPVQFGDLRTGQKKRAAAEPGDLPFMPLFDRPEAEPVRVIIAEPYIKRRVSGAENLPAGLGCRYLQAIVTEDANGGELYTAERWRRVVPESLPAGRVIIDLADRARK